MVTTITGTFYWGPERPSFANGAVVFLKPRDCAVLEHWCRTKEVQLQSKHAVVSAEYMQLFGAAMRECEKCVPPCHDEGRQRFITRRASTINELSWFAAPEYSEHMMRALDIESHHSLSFEGSEWLLREPAQKEQKSGPNGQANHGRLQQLQEALSGCIERDSRCQGGSRRSQAVRKLWAMPRHLIKNDI